MHDEGSPVHRPLPEILLPDPDGSPATPNAPIVLDYDEASRLRAVTDQEDSTTSYDYNHGHWFTQVLLPAPVESGTPPETKYEYDDVRNLKNVRELLPGGGSPPYRVTVSQYGALNRLDTLTMPDVQHGTGGDDSPT